MIGSRAEVEAKDEPNPSMEGAESPMRNIQAPTWWRPHLGIVLIGILLGAPISCDTGPATENRDPSSNPMRSTRLLATTEPATAAAWDRWRSLHADVELEDLGPHLERTLEATPFERAFFATAYATPVLPARRVRDDIHRHPIYETPPPSRATIDLPVRREASTSDLAAIAWIADGLDAYLVEVNGAARLDLADGDPLHLAWGRTNERPYTSVGRLMIERGIATEDEVDLAFIRERHAAEPRLVESLMLENDRMVFFDVIDAASWPRASTGVRLRPDASVAVDPEVIPLGSVLRIRGPSIGTRFAVAVDIGGAIKDRRLDLYLGAGPEALAAAGEIREPVRVDIVRPRPKDDAVSR